MFSPVHHVAISVSDLGRSVAFYEGVLGFRQVVDMPIAGEAVERLLRLAPGTKGRSVILQHEKARVGEIELIEFDPPTAAPSAPKRPGDPGVFLLSFAVTGERLEDVYDRLVEGGISCWTEPQRLELEGVGQLVALTFEDPDGVVIELVQSPRSGDNT